MVCGIVVDGFSVWGGGMSAASSWLDARGAEVDTVGADGCGGVFSESGGGGGGGDGGGGDGVGEWLGVIGLGEVWLSNALSGRRGESKSENIWLICRAMSSTFSSPPVGAVAGRSAWGTGTVDAIVEDRRAITLASLSRFISKVDIMVATIVDYVSCPIWCPPDVNIGVFVEIF